MRARRYALVMVTLAVALAGCGGDDTESQLAEQEARMAELEAQLAAALTTTTNSTTTTTTTTTTEPTTTTLPQAYVEARDACRAARDDLTAIRDEALELEYERNDWNQRRNDYLDGKISTQDEAAESALASIRAASLRRLSFRLWESSYPPAFNDFASDLGLFIDALTRESDLEVDFVLMSPSPYQRDLIERATVAFHEWVAYEPRIAGGEVVKVHQDCLAAAEPLMGECEDCVTG